MQGGCSKVADILLERLAQMSNRAIAAALRASHSLDAGTKIEIARRVVEVASIDDPMVASGLASLIKTLVPQTQTQADEVEQLKATLTGKHWDAGAILAN